MVDPLSSEYTFVDLGPLPIPKAIDILFRSLHGQSRDSIKSVEKPFSCF